MYHYNSIYNKHNDVISLLSMLYRMGRIFQKHSASSYSCLWFYLFLCLFEELAPIPWAFLIYN